MNSLRGRDTDREHDFSGYQQRDYDRDGEQDSGRDNDRNRNRVQDSEISLGTGTILGIFFALALLCALFFGFGYSMGRKSAQPTASIADGSPSTGFFGGTKPSPGSPVPAALKPAAPAAPTDNDSEQNPDPPTQPLAESSTPRQTPTPARSFATTASDGEPTPVVAKPAVKPAAAPAPDSAIPQTDPNGTTMVQVAAVSHQEDADLLLSALKTRGYAVFARQEPQDRLLHIQVGPFLTRKDADAMRLRLLADGYKAIVK